MSRQREFPIFLCSFSAGRFVVRSPSGKQTFYFEDSNRFGPSMLDVREDTLAEVPANKRWFWRFYQPWREAGRPTDGRPLSYRYGEIHRAMWVAA